MSNIITKNVDIRIASIDIFRALTMFLMIFVNDFHSSFPNWLGHADFHEDFLGFSDIIFPAFLFVMGMSIPHAIEKRYSKGETHLNVLFHIALRTVALFVMGLFMVNWGTGLHQDLWLNRSVFALIALACFFMIWNIYPKKTNLKWLFVGLQILGILVLVYLAVIYRDREGLAFIYKNDAGGIIVQTRWWGILALIGWSYVVSALIYTLVRNNFTYLLIAWALIVIYSMFGASDSLGILQGIVPDNGTLQAFSMSGILVSLYFSRWVAAKKPPIHLILRTISVGVLLIIAGIVARQFWIVSKLAATPSWMFLCTGISIIAYSVLYFAVDIKGKSHWFKIISTAGTATLTCYLVPAIIYPLLTLAKFSYPTMIVAYPQGVIKCILFSLLCIGVTTLLGKIGIKLKI